MLVFTGGAWAEEFDWWGFDTDPGLQTQHDGTDTNFWWEIADGTLKVSMSREDATQRVYMPLQESYGDDQKFRVRCKFRFNTDESTATASQHVGYCQWTFALFKVPKLQKPRLLLRTQKLYHVRTFYRTIL